MLSEVISKHLQTNGQFKDHQIIKTILNILSSETSKDIRYNLKDFVEFK